jgi:hypothetical protein
MKRSSAMPTTMMSASASAMDFHSTARSGGENIWMMALVAASSMMRHSALVSRMRRRTK